MMPQNHGPFAHPVRPHTPERRMPLALILPIILLGGLALGHFGTKAVANLAHYHVQIEGMH